ncbi:MAG: hypothetical protein R3321_01395 [Nitrososphaeraceae archaeon]|nr:hypothetical protein [Nitrososphaeraceae archaeon]
MKISGDDILVIKVSLQLLVVSWWIGAVTALISFLIPVYNHHILVAGFGWLIILGSTILIIYEIRRIKEEDKQTKL